MSIEEHESYYELDIDVTYSVTIDVPTEELHNINELEWLADRAIERGLIDDCDMTITDRRLVR